MPSNPSNPSDHFRQCAEAADDLAQRLAAAMERTAGKLDALDAELEAGQVPTVTPAELAVELRLAADEAQGITHRLGELGQT